MDSDERSVYRFYLIVGLITIALITLGALVNWVIYPAWLEYQNRAIENSRGNVTTLQDQIHADIENYRALETDIALYTATDPVKYADVIRGLQNQQITDVCDARAAREKLRVDLYPDRLTAEAVTFFAETQEVVCH